MISHYSSRSVFFLEVIPYPKEILPSKQRSRRRNDFGKVKIKATRQFIILTATHNEEIEQVVLKG